MALLPMTHLQSQGLERIIACYMISSYMHDHARIYVLYIYIFIYYVYLYMYTCMPERIAYGFGTAMVLPTGPSTPSMNLGVSNFQGVFLRLKILPSVNSLQVEQMVVSCGFNMCVFRSPLFWEDFFFATYIFRWIETTKVD